MINYISYHVLTYKHVLINFRIGTLIYWNSKLCHTLNYITSGSRVLNYTASKTWEKHVSLNKERTEYVNKKNCSDIHVHIHPQISVHPKSFPKQKIYFSLNTISSHKLRCPVPRQPERNIPGYWKREREIGVGYG